jgi:hypothetical protein
MLKVLMTTPGPRWTLLLGLSGDDVTELAGGGELAIDSSVFPVGADASKITVVLRYGRTEQALLETMAADATPEAIAALMPD